MTKADRIMAKVRKTTLQMAPLLGLNDWQFNFQSGTSEPLRAAEVDTDPWNHRATVYWDTESPGYSDESFFMEKIIHELLHCVFARPSSIHQRGDNAEIEAAGESGGSCYTLANEEAVASLARNLWYRLIKPLWDSKQFGEYPREWGKNAD